ncbi:DUF4252 domain-containing protein [Hoylesella oralis]|uniref:DUF4252 domain-containing protein n=1 Tax=Hoylesella oralis TaxID=28134 RepID=UPI00360E360B
MKKLIFALFLLCAAQTSFAQKAHDIFEQFKDKPKVEYVHIPRIMLNMARKFMKNDEDKDAIRIIKHIDSVRVLDLEECSADVKAEFYNETKNFNAKGYDELISTIEDGDKTLILTKGKGDTITELLILETGKDDCELVQIKGKITQAEIDQIIKEHQKDK